MHKKLKTGLLCLNCDSVNETTIRPGEDIFGHPQSHQMATENCECCNCSRTLIASRFAPHLEKCMGLGRTSSRLATKRIQNVEKPTKDESDVEYPAPQSFMDGDGDWKDPSYDGKAKSKVRKSQLPKIPGSSHNKKRIRYATEKFDFSDPNIRALLLTTCGVISPLTGKMCTKTLKCPQHNDALRNNLRGKVNILFPSDPVPLLGNDYVNGQSDLHALNGNSSNSSHDKNVDSLEENGKNPANGKRLFADISPTIDQLNSQSDMSPPSPLVIVDIDGDESENEYSEISSAASPPLPNHVDELKKIKIENMDN